MSLSFEPLAAGRLQAFLNDVGYTTYLNSLQLTSQFTPMMVQHGAINIMHHWIITRDGVVTKKK